MKFNEEVNFGKREEEETVIVDNSGCGRDPAAVFQPDRVHYGLHLVQRAGLRIGIFY